MLNYLNLHLKMVWALSSKEQTREDNYWQLTWEQPDNRKNIHLSPMQEGIKMERNGKDLCMRVALTSPRCPRGGWQGSLSGPCPCSPPRCCCRCRQRGRRRSWRCTTAARTGALHTRNTFHALKIDCEAWTTTYCGFCRSSEYTK